MATTMTYLAVAAGGGVGATLRFAFGAWALRAFGGGFPWGTLGVNVIGGFLMGALAVLLVERMAAPRLAPLLMTGVLGGFTTFSAFSLDTVLMLERGEAAKAALYVAASVVLSIGALWAGAALARGAA
jgi:fluoride exporter